MVKMCKMNFARLILLLKSNPAFYSIGEDHAHEQNNKVIKGDGGAIGIFDHEEALLEWAVCGPEIADKFQDLPDIYIDDCYQFHHQNTDNFEKTFRNDSNKLFGDFLRNGNSLVECEQDLVNVVSKNVVNTESLKSVHEALSIDSLTSCKKDKSLYDHIKMNKLPLLNPKVASKSSKGKEKIKLVYTDCRLFSNLFSKLKSLGFRSFLCS